MQGVNVRKQVAELKAALARAINCELDAFEQKTGLRPSAVRVNMVDVTVANDGVRRNMVSTVDLSFDL